MSQRLIIGEAVEVELPVARFATRVLALLIDAFVQVVLIYVFQIVLTPFANTANEASVAAIGILLLVAVFLIWPVAFETVTRGRSPGKYALGLRVVRDDGGPIRFRHALVRGLVGLTLEWPGILLPFITWIIGASTMLFSSRAKRLGDFAAGTLVIVERQPDLGRPPMPMPQGLATWAGTLDLSRVDDQLALCVRQFVTRAHRMRKGARLPLALRLGAELRAVSTPPPPPGVTLWDYFVAVLAERSRREKDRLVARRAVVALGAPELPWDLTPEALTQANSVSPQ
jgi:uncharacterized RDD family membrane protein YckC